MVGPCSDCGSEFGDEHDEDDCIANLVGERDKLKRDLAERTDALMHEKATTEALRASLITAAGDVRVSIDTRTTLLALVAGLDADLTLAKDALETAAEDVLTVVRGGKRDLGRAHTRIDVAIQTLATSRAMRSSR